MKKMYQITALDLSHNEVAKMSVWTDDLHDAEQTVADFLTHGGIEFCTLETEIVNKKPNLYHV
jgi:hypothetical protein